MTYLALSLYILGCVMFFWLMADSMNNGDKPNDWWIVVPFWPVIICGVLVAMLFDKLKIRTH